jgi:iron complex outermembrane receptor protein
MKISKGWSVSGGLSASLAIGAAAFAPSALRAQQPARSEEQLEEVVVTAQRRAETAMETAISVEILTGDDLASRGVQTVADLQNALPNIQILPAGMTRSVNIRGVGNNSIDATASMGVQVIHDGLSQGESMGNQAAFFDIDTIQVLRGPQGTFVGQSAAGGAILINSVSPNLDGFSGFVEGTVGDYNRTKVTGAINLPISDTMAARIAFNNEDRDSYFVNDGTRSGFDFEPQWSPGALEDQNLRMSLLWEPTDAFRALFKFEKSFVSHNTDAFQPNRLPYVGLNGVTTFSPYINFDNPDPRIITTDLPESDFQEAKRTHATLSYRFENGVELRSMTNFQRMDFRTNDDFQNSAVFTLPFQMTLGPDNDTTSQEIDLISPDGPLNWIVGVSYHKRHTPRRLTIPIHPNNSCGYQFNGALVPCLPAGTPALFVIFSNDDTINYQQGLFGQVNWQFSDKWELQFGARQNWDEQNSINVANFTGFPTPTPAGYPPAPPVALQPCPVGVDPQYRCTPSASPPSTQYKGDVPTAKIALNFTPTDNQFIYMFYARGYKAGRTTNGFILTHETIDDYEVGWKSTMLDGKMQFELGAFYMDYQDMQQSVFRVGPTNSVVNGADNIGDSTIQGIETAVRASLGGFNLDFSLGYTDSELGAARTLDTRRLPGSTGAGNFRLPQCGLQGAPAAPACFDYGPYFINVEGAANPNSPELSYSARLGYAFTLDNGASLEPSLSFFHTDASENTLIQGEPYYRVFARDIVNASLTFERDDWTVQAFINNATDELYNISAGDYVLYGEPRNIGVRIRLNF